MSHACALFRTKRPFLLASCTLGEKSACDAVRSFPRLGSERDKAQRPSPLYGRGAEGEGGCRPLSGVGPKRSGPQAVIAVPIRRFLAFWSCDQAAVASPGGEAAHITQTAAN